MANKTIQLQDKDGNNLYPETSDAYYPGDRLTSHCICPAYITNNGSIMLFIIPLAKPIKATGFTVNSMSFSGARTVEHEYLKDGTVVYNATSRSVPVTNIYTRAVNPSGLRISISAATRWNKQDGSAYTEAPLMLYIDYDVTFT